MVQFECPKYRNPCVSFIFWMILFSPFPLSGVIRNGSPLYKDQKLEKFQNKISSTG